MDGYFSVAYFDPSYFVWLGQVVGIEDDYFEASFFDKAYFDASYFPGNPLVPLPPRLVLCPPFTLDVGAPLRAGLRVTHRIARLEVGCKP